MSLDRSWSLGFQPGPGPLGALFETARDVPDEFSELHKVELEVESPGAQPSDLDEILGQLHETVDLPLQTLELLRRIGLLSAFTTML